MAQKLDQAMLLQSNNSYNSTPQPVLLVSKGILTLRGLRLDNHSSFSKAAMWHASIDPQVCDEQKPGEERNLNSGRQLTTHTFAAGTLKDWFAEGAGQSSSQPHSTSART
jgi:hypothetical protein